MHTDAGDSSLIPFSVYIHQNNSLLVTYLYCVVRGISILDPKSYTSSLRSLLSKLTLVYTFVGIIAWE